MEVFLHGLWMFVVKYGNPANQYLGYARRICLGNLHQPIKSCVYLTWWFMWLRFTFLLIPDARSSYKKYIVRKHEGKIYLNNIRIPRNMLYSTLVYTCFSIDELVEYNSTTTGLNFIHQNNGRTNRWRQTSCRCFFQRFLDLSTHTWEIMIRFD